MFGISIARVDQNATLARNSVVNVSCLSPTKVQIFKPLVDASTSRVMYIHTEMAMIAGAAIEESNSTALIPSAVLMIWTVAKITYQIGQLSNPVRYSMIPLKASAPR